MFTALVLFTQFFTKLNIPIAIPEPTNKFRSSIQYLTLFSFLLGCLEAGIVGLFMFILPKWLVWIFYWIIDGLITGGFHLDALADMADGLFSSRQPAKILDIMKDSRIGTMGALALIYYYILAIALGINLARILSPWCLLALVVTCTMVTKTGLSLLFYRMVYAGKKNGLSVIWLHIAPWRIVIAQVFSVIIIGWFFSWAGLISYGLIIVSAYFYRRKIVQILGGFSGDTLGAFASLTPVIFLFGLNLTFQLLR